MRSRNPVMRWLNAQVVVLAAAGRVFRRPPEPRPGTFAYAKSSPYRWMPWLVLLSLPADGLLIAVALPSGWEVVAWVLLGVTLYFLLWVVGVGVTMRERPHEVSAAGVVLRHGVLASASFPTGAIASVVTHPGFAPGTPGARRYLRGAGLLTVGPGPFVEVRLRSPVTVERVAVDRTADRIIVRADDLSTLQAALVAAARPTPILRSAQGHGSEGDS